MPQVDLDMQAEFLAMQTLSIPELKEIALAQIDVETQNRHLALLDQNSQGDLTTDEQHELANLRLHADQFTLRKAYAWALLRWRGYPMPKLTELPLN